MATLDLTRREEGLLTAALEAYARSPEGQTDGFSLEEIVALSNKVHLLVAPAASLYRVGTVSWRGDNWTPLMQPAMPEREALAFVAAMTERARARGIVVYYDLKPV